MRVDQTSLDNRTSTHRMDERRLQPIVNLLENRQLLNADFHAFGSHESVVSGIDETVTVAHYITSPTGHIDSATIDWGDGTSTTVGTIESFASSPSLGTLGSIQGDHVYASTGSYTVKTTLIEHKTDAEDVTSTVSSTLAVVAPQMSVTPAPSVLAAQGQAITDQTLAYVRTNVPNAEQSFKVTIDWGDGSTPTSGTISSARQLPLLHDDADDEESGIGDGSLPGYESGFHGYVIAGSHTYAVAGSYTAIVTIDDGLGDVTTTSTLVTVASSTLVATSPASANAVAGLAVTGPLAKVTDIATVATADAGSLTATIDWGDGSAPTSGEIQPARGAFIPSNGPPTYVVSGSHTFTSAGDTTVTITITDASGRTATTSTVYHVRAETLTLSPSILSASTGQPGTFQVAAGADTPIVRASHLSATIDWGDGTTTTDGRVFVTNGPIPDSASVTTKSFVVVGEHQYTSSGNYTIHVTVTSDAGATATADSTVTVASFAAFGLPKFAKADTPLTNEPLAIVGIPANSAAASDFSASIDWGDGSSSDSATIVSRAGRAIPAPEWVEGSRSNYLLVEGTHTYTSAGQYTATITITDAKTGEFTVVKSSITVVAASGSSTGDGGGNPGTTAPPIVPISLNSGSSPTTSTSVGSSSGTGATSSSTTVSVPSTSTHAHSTHHAKTTVSVHSKKSSTKAIHHVAKTIIKSKAHHPHGPLG